MKPKIITKILILLLVTIALALGGCQPAALHTEEQFKLHTLCQITTFGKLEDKVYQEVWDAMDTIDNTMSMSLAKSEIKAINDAAGVRPVTVSDDVFYVIETALKYSDRSDKFDISIGPIVSLWGIGSDNPKVPDASVLSDKMAFVNYEKIQIDKEAKSVFLLDKEMAIDVGAVAKGFAADRAKEILEKNHVKRAIVNFGGNILTIGSKQNNKPWQIGVQHPDQSRGAYFGIIPLDDKTIVTSGTYERYFEANGKRYHHILDTKTGYPVDNGLLSVSIITDSSINADVLSTLIFAEGLERGLAFIESLEDVEAIFVTSENRVYLSSGLKNQFQLADDAFTLMP